MQESRNFTVIISRQELVEALKARFPESLMVQSMTLSDFRASIIGESTALQVKWSKQGAAPAEAFKMFNDGA